MEKPDSALVSAQIKAIRAKIHVCSNRLQIVTSYIEFADDPRALEACSDAVHEIASLCPMISRLYYIKNKERYSMKADEDAVPSLPAIPAK